MAESAPRTRELTSLQWMVSARSRIQQLSLDIVSLVENHKHEVGVNTEDGSHLAQLIGGAFSLWRAVFLADTPRNIERTLPVAQEFLETVVNTNMIGFAQDYKLREWAFGYYINNAKYRIIAINSKNPEYMKRLRRIDSRTFPGEKLDAIFEHEISGRNTKTLWDDCYDALRISIQSVSDTIFEKSRAGRSE